MSLDTSWGGTNLSTKNFTTYRVIKPLIPPQEQFGFDIPDKSGFTQVFKRFGANSLIVRGTISGSTPANLKTNIATLSSFLYSDGDTEIIFSDDTGKYWNAQYLDTVEVIREETQALLDLIFTCNDPFAYDTTADTDTEAGITTNDTTYTVANSGHYYAYPVVTITFNQAMEHIYVQNNDVSGNRFDVSKPFASNDKLEVDCKNGTIKLNSTTSPAGFGDGGDGSAEWLVLAKGNNQLQVGSDDATIDCDVDLSWRKVYLS
jgi:predicted phage tail component-like protein